MKILEFQNKIAKIIKNLKIKFDNNENHVNPRTTIKNREHYENLRIPSNNKKKQNSRIQFENHENYENLRISIRIKKFLENHRISIENNENHENFNYNEE